MVKDTGGNMRSSVTGLLVAQGVIAVLFGIAALFWPALAMATFISLFGIFVLVWGVILLVSSLINANYRSLWWVDMVLALLLVGLGVFTLRNPDIATTTMILVVGFTLIARGVVDIVSGLFSREQDVVSNRWFIFITGALGLVLGIVVLNHPGAGGLAFIWALGLYAVLYGALTIGLASRIHSVK